jgi:hypothetical protein
VDSEGVAVWAQTTHGGLLHDLFGSFPALHDALVRSLDIDRAGNRVSMVVDYSDTPEEASASLTVRINLVWSDVRSMDLNLRENALSGMGLREQQGAIVTEFEQSFGIGGVIVAEHFEAILVQVDPPEPDNFEQRVVRLRYA